VSDLLGPEYEIALKGQLKLESKESMKKRGIGSPDDADALALTFAFPVSYKSGSSRKSLRKSSLRSFGAPSAGAWMQ
jgi:hypothetical protein